MQQCELAVFVWRGGRECPSAEGRFVKDDESQTVQFLK
jgi:hypothetical protein